MELNIKDNGIMINKKEKENNSGKMVQNTKVNTNKEKNKDMEYFFGQILPIMKECFQIIK